ncbi:putative RNA-directed DNA polymerase from transposon BS [Stylophora pistillata]|uniref:Putative RNA-directed DNA polymerase from transposon BS n=1 Tax=Stylophora pistillata TaxID=50429 RepID=A0A2B4SEE8_STYPI|nr:putative RNA-directed DNA polymerase from transposon BS [Stylophora pistillata]
MIRAFSKRIQQLQHGFQPGKSTETQLLEVYHDILDKLTNGQEVDVIHLDLSKAFDKVAHRLLLSKLQLLGISGPVLLWFSSYLSDRYQRVVVDGISSDWFPVPSGVPQGSILGPLLFLVFINDMSCSITHGSKLGLFADDSKLYRSIVSDRCASLLQADLDNSKTWCDNNGMSFSTNKCKVPHMSKRTSRQREKHTYHLDGQTLDSPPDTKGLGVTVTTPLSWKTHIEEICAKYNKVLGLVKRVCGRDIVNVSTKKMIHTALVRPIVEYVSSAWSPYTAKHRGLIENIQRRATKFILNYPDRKTSYTARLKTLSLLPLEFRREVHDLVILYKIRYKNDNKVDTTQ